MPSLPPLKRKEIEIVIEAGIFSCRLYNAPLDEGISKIAAETGMQFVHRGRLHANVSANLTDIPIETAIEILFGATPYELKRVDNIYRIGRPDSDDRTPIMQKVRFQYVEVARVLRDLQQA